MFIILKLSKLKTNFFLFLQGATHCHVHHCLYTIGRIFPWYAISWRDGWRFYFMSKNFVCVLIALMGVIAAFQTVIPVSTVAGGADGTEEPGCVEGGDGLILRSMEIDTTIDNSYAITELTLSYENTGNESREASFGLSLPGKAFVSNFTIILGNQTHFGEVLGKGEAQQKYDDAVSSGNTAGIGKQTGAERFTFSVNVAEYENLSATLRYEEFIPKYLGERTYSLLFSTMDMRPQTFDLSIDIRSTTEITGLDTVNSEYSLTEVWNSSRTLSLLMTQDSPQFVSDLDVTYQERDLQVNGTFQGYYDIEADEYYFMNIFSPGREEVGDGFPKDIIFVLDKSGSMSGDSMNQLKQSFNHILDQLPENDRFNIIMFDTGIKTYRQELIPATYENKNNAKNYLGGQNAGGSTNLYDGLERALQMLTHEEARVPIIVMLTDGLANQGRVTSAGAIRAHIQEQNTIMCPIFCLGYGYSVDFPFLSALSLENYAQAQQIHPNQDASEQIVNFYRTISTTLLRDITHDHGERSHSTFPEVIPALYEGSETIIVGKYSISEDNENLTSVITARTSLGTRELKTTSTISYNDTEHSSVKRYWAFARIHYLMDHLPMYNATEREQAEAEIESISIDAHFVTPYTSLFLEIADEDPNAEDPSSWTESETDSNSGMGSSGSTSTQGGTGGTSTHGGSGGTTTQGGSGGTTTQGGSGGTTTGGSSGSDGGTGGMSPNAYPTAGTTATYGGSGGSGSSTKDAGGSSSATLSPTRPSYSDSDSYNGGSKLYADAPPSGAGRSESYAINSNMPVFAIGSLVFITFLVLGIVMGVRKRRRK
jgi:uncharacterized protein YegL